MSLTQNNFNLYLHLCAKVGTVCPCYRQVFAIYVMCSNCIHTASGTSDFQPSALVRVHPPPLRSQAFRVDGGNSLYYKCHSIHFAVWNIAFVKATVQTIVSICINHPHFIPHIFQSPFLHHNLNRSFLSPYMVRM